MLIKFLSYYFFLVLVIFLPGNILGQTGRTILNVTFGDSVDNPGPPLPAINTGFNFSADACPPPGFYTITNSMYRCPSYRFGRSIDNTPRSKNGYMMLVNDTTSRRSKIIYIDTLKETLCPGTPYQFSAYLINPEIPGYCSSSFVHSPRFTFSIETTAGVVLQASHTGPMGYDYVPPPPPTPFTPKFHFYGVDFVMPAGVTALVLKIKDDSAGYSRCGYAFALDDIQFTALGPESKIAFDSARYGETIMGTCFQNNKNIAMSGTVGRGFSNVAVQWQQSFNNGITWTDIPGATNYNYSRIFSVPDTFLFRLRASEADKIGNENCSIVSNTLKVEVDGIPSDLNVTSNSPVCAGDNLQLNAEGGASYVWSGPNGFYDDVSYAHIFHSVLADSGTYYAQIMTFGGCTAKDSVHVTIKGIRNVKAGPDTSICKGKSVVLNVTEGVNYSWSPAKGLSSVSIKNPSATPDVSTVYSVKVTSEDGCSNSDSVKVNLLNAVAVKAIISGPGFVCFPHDTTSFSNKSLGKIANSAWDFGDGQSSTLFDPLPEIYTVDIRRSDYSVRLAVADSVGCSDTSYHIMKIESNCYIAVPTAFTPNGDGRNDYLYPLNAYKATNLIFRVYNRQGQLVFQTIDWTKKWDGRVNSEPQAEGVYVWTLSYIDGNKKYVSLKGSTMLIR